MEDFRTEKKLAAVISWNDITASTIPKGSNPSRRILTKVSGVVKPGEFLAVMGPSGAGKTTLLNCLSNRKQNTIKIESCNIFLNYNPINPTQYSSLIGFVPQDDILFTSMTPREILDFSAGMTLRISPENKKMLVDQTLKELGLNACADTVVGGLMTRGLSGGEKKRTSVGMELICNPSVLFLDEPTTGLDSFIALQIIELLVSIAKNYNRTIIATIHQPSSQIFNCFDRLLLLSKGATVFMGRASESIKYFKQLGFGLPENYNPADYFLTVISENLISIPEFAVKDSFIQQIVDFDENKVYRASFFKALYLLTWRNALDMIRNPLNLANKFVKLVVISLMFTAVFWKLGYDETGIYDRESAIFVLICSLEIEAHLTVVPTFQMNKLVFIREYKQNRYGAFAYFLSYNLIMIPIEIVWDVVFVLSVYYSLDFNNNSNSVLKNLLVCVLTGMIGTNWGMFISILGSTLDSALILSMMTLIPMWLSGGFLVNYSSIPQWFFFKWLSPYYFVFEAAARTELENLNGNNSELIATALKQLNLPDSYENAIIYAIASIIGFKMINYMLLKYINNYN